MSENYENIPTPEHAPIIERHRLLIASAEEILGGEVLDQNGITSL